MATGVREQADGICTLDGVADWSPWLPGSTAQSAPIAMASAFFRETLPITACMGQLSEMSASPFCRSENQGCTGPPCLPRVS